MLAPLFSGNAGTLNVLEKRVAPSFHVGKLVSYQASHWFGAPPTRGERWPELPATIASKAAWPGVLRPRGGVREVSKRLSFARIDWVSLAVQHGSIVLKVPLGKDSSRASLPGPSPPLITVPCGTTMCWHAVALPMRKPGPIPGRLGAAPAGLVRPANKDSITGKSGCKERNLIVPRSQANDGRTQA